MLKLDGELYDNCGTPSAGDLVSCCVEYFMADRSLVNFMKNDRLVFRQWVTLGPDQLYPTIGFENGPAEISVEWPLTDLSHARSLVRRPSQGV